MPSWETKISFPYTRHWMITTCVGSGGHVHVLSSFWCIFWPRQWLLIKFQLVLNQHQLSSSSENASMACFRYVNWDNSGTECFRCSWYNGHHQTSKLTCLTFDWHGHWWLRRCGIQTGIEQSYGTFTVTSRDGLWTTNVLRVTQTFEYRKKPWSRTRVRRETWIRQKT